MSESIRPTRWPTRSRARARLAATVDLPTPPLPEATAILKRTSLRISGVGGAAAAGRGGRRRRGLDVEADRDGGDARQAAQLLGRVALDLLGGRRDSVMISRRKETLPPPTGEVLDEAERHDVAREPREPDGPQDLQDFLLGQLRRGAHASSPARFYVGSRLGAQAAPRRSRSSAVSVGAVAAPSGPPAAIGSPTATTDPRRRDREAAAPLDPERSRDAERAGAAGPTAAPAAPRPT